MLKKKKKKNIELAERNIFDRVRVDSRRKKGITFFFTLNFIGQLESNCKCKWH